MAGFFDLPGWALPLARRFLYFWVRPTVFPVNLQEIGIDPSRPVCYVLQDHHLSNLLVLFEETARAQLPPAEASFRLEAGHFPHSFFFLNRKHSLRATARERYAHSRLMTALIHEAMTRPLPEIQIVPVVILWGRSPDKQESILKALFSETWRQPGPLRRFLTILLHGRNVLVRFSPPISLNALSSGNLDEAQAQRKLSRVLRVHFRRQREMAIGPDLSHRNTQIESLLAAPAVRTAIDAEAATHGLSTEQARQRARRFALEIASDYSYGAVRALELFLSWLWPRLFDGFEVHHIDNVTQIAPGQGIVYVPTHRSHIDYLLLSYLLHQHGLTPPHIAAGANLNMLLVGPLLRRCGAFFLRRSFKGEPLYAAVFHEYLHLMMTRGFPLEYFIEGGRSRNGRTLTPKAGILGMTIRSFIRERARPLVFVPVYIGYERIMEGRTYIRELAGKPKQKESLWAVLKSARRIRKVFGRVHLNFGQPLFLEEFLESFRPGWSLDPSAGHSDWPREATARAATELAQRLNEAVVINPVNLLALGLLSTPRHTADESMLLRVLSHYQGLAREIPYSAFSIDCPLDPRQCLAYVEQLRIVERIAHPLGDLIRVPDGDAPLLAYFRNNVLHVFALPALIACLLFHNRVLTAQRVTEAICGIYGLMGRELFLRWPTADLPGVIDAYLQFFIARKLLFQNARGRLSIPESNTQEFAELRLMGETLRPVLERHFLILALLQHCGSGKRTRRSLENDCHLLAQRIALLYDIQTAEHTEKTSFSALIAYLLDAELLREDDTGLLYFDANLTTPLAHAELVLPAETRQTIMKMACSGLSIGSAA